jgi:hypothetical protein
MLGAAATINSFGRSHVRGNLNVELRQVSLTLSRWSPRYISAMLNVMAAILLWPGVE